MLEESEDGSQLGKVVAKKVNLQVIGPKNDSEKIPEVLQEGVEILDGEFDYDISVLDVDEYGALNLKNLCHVMMQSNSAGASHAGSSENSS